MVDTYVSNSPKDNYNEGDAYPAPSPVTIEYLNAQYPLSDYQIGSAAKWNGQGTHIDPTTGLYTGTIQTSQLQGSLTASDTSNVDGVSAATVVNNAAAGAKAAGYFNQDGTLNTSELKYNPSLYTPVWENSYANWSDTTFETPSVTKMDDGLIVFGGRATIGTLNVAMFNLPTTMRPVGTRSFSVLTSAGLGEIDIYANGDIILSSGGVVAGWVSLDGITYLP